MGDDEQPIKLSIKRKTGNSAGESLPDAGTGGRVVKRRKRVIKLETTAKKQKQDNQPPAKKKKRVAPSVIRASDLNKALSEHSKAWRSMSPLSHDIEKQVFRFISERHLSASKRVVKTLLKKHQSAINYLKNSEMDSPICDLQDNQTGLVSWERASLAAKLLVTVVAQKAADKRVRRRK